MKLVINRERMERVGESERVDKAKPHTFLYLKRAVSVELPNTYNESSTQA